MSPELHQHIAIFIVFRHLVSLVIGKPDVIVLIDEQSVRNSELVLIEPEITP